MYHRIAVDGFDPWGLAVAPERFTGQMEWLRANRTVLPLSEFAERHRDRSLPSNAIALTFDDGYACVAEVAAPLLERFGLAATIFVPVELVTRGEPFWWDELQRIVIDSDSEQLLQGGERIRLGAKSSRDAAWKPYSPPRTPRQNAFLTLWRTLREKAPAELDAAMDELRRQAPDPGEVPQLKRPMSPAQVRAIASDRIDFGSHALTHPSLPSLPAKEKARQIQESVSGCQALTGRVPTAFAYPYGDFDEESAGLVEDAGFGCACTTAGRSVTLRASSFALPRIGIGDWRPQALARALESA